MNISYNWLKQYLNTDHSVDRMSEILTSIGLEVEGVKEFSAIPGGLKGLVVGEVLECGPHPNADKLSVTKVDVGDGEAPLNIVCGAPNVAAGQKVVVAGVGSTIYPNEGEPFDIKKAKIRGERSAGMICSEDEIGVGKNRDGIIVLDPSIKAGTQAREVYNVEEDFIFDIGLTPNRSDATSHIGVAEDVLAWLRVNENHQKDINYPVLEGFEEGPEVHFTVKIEDEKACPWYSGLLIKNVKVGESPEWLQTRLKSIGARPVNNVVDITNFVLHEFGQPLHAFDLKKIKGNGIVVTQLPAGTEFVTLDEKERKLDAEDLMICNAEREPLCIAGVFGGLGSGVDENTTDLFLESAHFDATSVRKTSTRHLLRTDAAKIFEKGSDPEVTLKALKRAALLISEIAGGEPASQLFDLYPSPVSPAVIKLETERVRKLTGAPMTDEEIVEILQAMNMKTQSEGNGKLRVSVPTNKSDVTREADLVEEILRIYGYDRVPFSNSINIPLIPGNFPDKHLVGNRIADYLSSLGLLQTMNLSLVKSDWYEEGKEELVYIHNTSNESLNIMRPDLLHSSLATVAYNLNRQQTDLRLYEIGKSYSQKDGEITETEHLAIALSGDWNTGNWRQQTDPSNYHSLVHLVKSLTDLLGIESPQFTQLEEHPWFDFGAEIVVKGKTLGLAGKVANSVCEVHEISEEVFYADLDWKLLIKTAQKTRVVSRPVSKFPTVSRDLALIVNEGVQFKAIESIVLKAGGRKVHSVGLFDVYTDEEKLGPGKKSYAVNMVFSDPNKTLKDKEVDKMIKKMLHALKNELGADLR